MKLPPDAQYIRIRYDDGDALADFVNRVISNPGSWFNAQPELDLDKPQPSDSALIALFSARGPSNPLATVVSGEGDGPIEVGMQHRLGPRASGVFAELGHPIPDTWHVTQDHPRRGLVIDVGRDEPSLRIAQWVLAALDLAGRAPATDGVIVQWFDNG